MSEASTRTTVFVPVNRSCTTLPGQAALPRVRRALGFGLILAMLFGSFGCASGDIWVYVDNAGKEEMVVSVDGNEVATIEPGKCTRIECPPGERRFHVACGKTVLFDGTKDLKPSDQFLVGRRYFFNPDKRGRYILYTVKYGSSPLEGLLNSEENSGDRRSQIRSAYKKLAAEVKLMSPDPWFEVPTRVGVFEKPPEMVVTSGYSEKREFMTRVTSKDYAFLKAAQSKTNPSEEDLDALEEVLDRVTD